MPTIPIRSLEIIDRQQLALLAQPSNWHAALHLAFRIFGEVCLFWLSLCMVIEGSLWCLPVFLACGVWHSFWGYAGIGHEFYHGRVFSSSWFNRAAFRVASYLTLNNPQFFADSHGLHHKNTFSEQDQEARALQPWGRGDILRYSLIDLPLLARRFLYIGFNVLGRVPGGQSIGYLSTAHRREAFGMVAFQCSMHTFLWVTTKRLESNILFLLLPVTGLLLVRVLAQSQHLGLRAFRNQGPLRHSRTIRLPWLLEFLYTGMNFHAEHHLAPIIPYYNLKRLHDILVSRGLLESRSFICFFCNDFYALLRSG